MIEPVRDLQVLAVQHLTVELHSYRAKEQAGRVFRGNQCSY
jgi:hypothetical protein